ncbi:hypothetical protein ANCDUO_24056, partial [Ancylostoma duodenale]
MNEMPAQLRRREQLVNEPPKLPESLWKSPWRRCQCDNSLPHVENTVNNAVNAAFAAVALPDVPGYEDAKGKGFDKFLTSFLMKYGSLNLDDVTLIHLLCSKLGGQPRVVMETLPQDVREGTFEGFSSALMADVREGTFEGFSSALMAKFKENESARRMEAYIKLKKLTPTNITEYCVDLEQLSRANSDNHNRLKHDEEQKNQVQNGKEKVQKKREPICHNCKNSDTSKEIVKSLYKAGVPSRKLRVLEITTTTREIYRKIQHERSLPLCGSGPAVQYMRRKEKSSRKTRPKMLSNVGNPTANDSAKVVARVDVRPGEAKILRTTVPNSVEGAKGAVTDPELTQTTLTKYNVQAEALLPIYEQAKVDNNNEVIERPLTLDDRMCVRVLAEEGSSKRSKVAEEWSGPLTAVELCENSAL